jgi:hypothetical protein
LITYLKSTSPSLSPARYLTGNPQQFGQTDRTHRHRDTAVHAPLGVSQRGRT